MIEKASQRALRIGKASAAFKKIVLDYPPMTAAIESLVELRIATEDREVGAPCAPVLLNAPIGTGKSMTLKMAAAQAAEGAPEGHIPLLVVQMPTAGTTESIPGAILKALRHPRPDKGRTEDKWLRAKSEMQRKGVVVVAFDEFNRAGRRPTMSQPIARSINEHIMEESIAAVAFVGTADAAVVLDQCPEILDRLDTEIDLSPLLWSIDEDRELFLQFVADLDVALVDQKLLNESSGLANEDVARSLCEASQGRLRPLIGIIRTAMTMCLREHGNFITHEHLRQSVNAYALRVGLIERNPFA